MCYSAAVLCLLWIIIYNFIAHGCSTAQRDTQHAFKVKDMIKRILHISNQIAVKRIHSSTPPQVGPYFTVGLNVITFVFIGTIRWVCTD